MMSFLFSPFSSFLCLYIPLPQFLYTVHSIPPPNVNRKLFPRR